MIPSEVEWLEADGLGGFATGSSSTIPERRYHGLLAVSLEPPVKRFMLVNAVEVWLEVSNQRFPLSTFRYGGGTLHPSGMQQISSFKAEPCPHWQYRAGDVTLSYKIVVPRGSPLVTLTWKKERGPDCRLIVRPLISGRDIHSSQHANSSADLSATFSHDSVSWQPYSALPTIYSVSNGSYHHEPVWFYNFLYEEEIARGYDGSEDLASPGIFSFDLGDKEGFLAFTSIPAPALSSTMELRDQELKRRSALPSIFHRSTEAFIVKRGTGLSIIAGYPWFSDWGRDTFIAMRGLCLAFERLPEAISIITAWCESIKDGLLPNRFVEAGEQPEYNSVDAALWFIVSSYETLKLARTANFHIAGGIRQQIIGGIDHVLRTYIRGTHNRIVCSGDGLLACGKPGIQLTWMDAKIGDWVVTPRIGKPVEIQALWINALRIGHELIGEERFETLYRKALRSFESRFWHEAGGYLYDVLDVNHQTGMADATLRPNQIFTVGGLPFPILSGQRAAQVVAVVEKQLIIPRGVRTLAPNDKRYVPVYQGNQAKRDAAYHEGTAWPWLMGGFVEAWLRVHDYTAAAKQTARERFVDPFLIEARQNGHIWEIADGGALHSERGAPFQAWSLGELMRLDRVVVK